MSDEHDPGVMGCYGDPLVQTNNLDRLASQGVTFDAAYTTSPLCVPARLSFVAGKYVSRAFFLIVIINTGPFNQQTSPCPRYATSSSAIGQS